MAIPVVKAILHGRADMHLTLLCKPQYVEWLKSLELADKVYSFRAGSWRPVLFSISKIKKEYPDAQPQFH